MTADRRSVVRSSVPVFHVSDLPEAARHGMTLYHGVLICWDEDYDPRVLELVDDMLADLHPFERENLIAVSESEGSVTFVWRGHEVTRYAGGGQVDVAGDSWSIMDPVII